MTRLSSIALTLAVFAAPIAAQQPTPPAPAPGKPISLDRIVGIIGDQPITYFDLRERIIQKRQVGEPIPTDSARAERAVLEEMIDEELLMQKAKELKIEVPDNDLNSTIDRQIKDIKARFPTEAEFRTELAKAGLGTPEEYRRLLLDDLRRRETIKRLMDKLREDNKLIPVNVSEQDVKDAFEKSRSQLPPRPAAVTFRQVVIAPKATEASKNIARAKAESLLAELKRGADFALLAKRESMDETTKDVGGDLGWQRRGQFVNEFERWVWSLPPGELSPVVESPFGFHIIRVDRVAAGEVKSRHILIMPKLDSADLKRAHAEADTVVEQWKAGVPFDSLTKKHHDFASKEETSLLTPFPRDSLPESYQRAFRGKKPNDIVVFEIPDPRRGMPKVVAAQLLTVDEGGERTLAEMKEMVRSNLAQQGGVRRYLDSLRQRTFVAIKLDQPPPSGPAQQK